MQTRDYGPLFFHFLEVCENSPRFHFADTTEIEPPFRIARPLVIRYWRGKALVVGIWRRSGLDEDAALVRALQGSGGFDLANMDDPEVRATVRRNIAESGLPLDDEWRIISMLGADK